MNDWPIIQHKEGVVTGMSVETTLRVSVDGHEVEAIAFVTAPNRRSLVGPVSERYIEALVRGTRASGLPEECIVSLPAKAR
ncbi:gamma-glutamylcyclotransferase [Bdellovibrio sp. HCB290]|uniref:gamma-glutamylcyclotransferase n=1 Tax=Bdellovibrio sp. HCB290 TaxID=3394356 RepID=UPI0039B526CF